MLDFVFGSEEDQKRHLDEIMGDLQPDGGFNNELQQAAEQTRGNIVIDEWSCALTGGALSGMEDQDAGRAEFCQAQAQLYADWTAGWSFWSECQARAELIDRLQNGGLRWRRELVLPTCSGKISPLILCPSPGIIVSS